MRQLSAIALLACLWCAACGVPPKQRFFIPEKEFREKVEVMCAFPPRLQFPHPEYERLQDELASDVAAELARGDFQAPPADKVEDIRIATAAAFGGAYDRHTGRMDLAKRDEVLRESRARLVRELGCDAFLYPTVAVVTAPWSDGIAVWDGARHSIGGGFSAYGHVGALSLWVRIENVDGKETYFGTGGIQVLSILNSGFFKSEFEDVDLAYILANIDDRRAAVRESLKPLLPEIDYQRDPFNAGKVVPR